jgi:hypothetical protein
MAAERKGMRLVDIYAPSEAESSRREKVFSTSTYHTC